MRCARAWDTRESSRLTNLFSQESRHGLPCSLLTVVFFSGFLVPPLAVCPRPGHAGALSVNEPVCGWPGIIWMRIGFQRDGHSFLAQAILRELDSRLCPCVLRGGVAPAACSQSPPMIACVRVAGQSWARGRTFVLVPFSSINLSYYFLGHRPQREEEGGENRKDFT